MSTQFLLYGKKATMKTYCGLSQTKTCLYYVLLHVPTGKTLGRFGTRRNGEEILKNVFLYKYPVVESILGITLDELCLEEFEIIEVTL